MSTYATPQEALTGLLLAGQTSMPQIILSAGFSPYYQEVPEPAPQVDSTGNPFPYVWFDVPDSDVEMTFEYALNEKFEPVVRVYMREQDIQKSASPYVSSSPFYYLDQYRSTPRILDGTNYECIQFKRKSWRLYKDPERGPDTGRVWIAEAKYDLWFST